MTQLEKAIELAVRAHAGQLDEGGMPHILHCMEVMIEVRKEFISLELTDQTPTGYTLEELLISAILHDTVEDTFVTLELIRTEFGTNVATIVDGVTRRGLGAGETKETYRDFIYRAKLDPGARLIKIKDLANNMGRLHMIPAKKARWREKLDYKYFIAMRVINSDEPNTTWENASWNVSYDQDEANTAHFFVADPNGKKIEISEAQFKTIKAGVYSA